MAIQVAIAGLIELRLDDEGEKMIRLRIIADE